MFGAIAGLAGTILGPVVGPVVGSIAGSIGQVLGGGAAGPGGATNPLGGLLGSIGSAFGDLFGAKKPLAPPPMCCPTPNPFSLPPGFPIGNPMAGLQNIMGLLQSILPALQNVLKQFGGGGGSTFPPGLGGGGSSFPSLGGGGGFGAPAGSIDAQAISMAARGDALSKDAMAILGDPNASIEQKIAAQQKLADAFQMIELGSTISKKVSDLQGKIIGNLA